MEKIFWTVVPGLMVAMSAVVMLAGWVVPSWGVTVLCQGLTGGAAQSVLTKEPAFTKISRAYDTRVGRGGPIIAWSASAWWVFSKYLYHSEQPSLPNYNYRYLARGGGLLASRLPSPALRSSGAEARCLLSFLSWPGFMRRGRNKLFLCSWWPHSPRRRLLAITVL